MVTGLSAVRATPSAGPLRGEVVVPGDKSISHRALILAALTVGGKTQVHGLAPGLDVASTMRCLADLGVKVALTRNGSNRRCPAATIEPPAGGLRPPARPLDAGNSATTLRLLAGVVASQPFSSILTGDASLRRRPMRRILAPLQEMGAEVDAVGGEGEWAPLVVRGPIPPRPLAARRHRLPMASAQVKSCLLLAGLHAAGRTTVEEPGLSRDHTERLMAVLGIDSGTTADGAVWVAGSDRPRIDPFELTVPGDFSSAAFLIGAALLVPGSEVRLPGVGVNPTRTGLLDVIARMGGTVKLENLRCPAGGGGEPVADLIVSGPPPGSSGEHVLSAVDVRASELPRLIDEVPILAVLATQARGVTRIEGAGELRFKETDRLEALAVELGRLGADIRVAGDRLEISGPTPLVLTRARSHGDHRLAMALTVAALVASGPTNSLPAIAPEGLEAAAVSYPSFYEDLAALREGE